MKSIAIMQPYLFPYIGYFQLIQSVDQFIVYDNIKYTKKGWINRNRLLRNGEDVLFSVPLKKDSDFLGIKDREIAVDFNKGKLLNQFREAYRRAPYFEQVFSLIEAVILAKESNLFRYIHNSIKETCQYLAIETEIVVSSNLKIDHFLHGFDKVVSICKHAGADIYINAIGGLELYSKEEFSAHNIQLKFLKSKPYEYKQFNNEFVPWLSIIDVMMFNSKDQLIENIRNNYVLI
jgi:WbqC-like protein family